MHFAFPRQRAGITLLLVILILSAILSISLGIIDVVLGEFRISGEITDSFTALYAADQGIERMLYDDRVLNAVCSGGGDCSYGPVATALSNGSCYTLRLNRSGGNTTVISTGEYRCTGALLSVKRAFEATYAYSATATPPQTLMEDNFGTGASENDIPNWEEEGNDNGSKTHVQTPGSGEESASPDGGRFAGIGDDDEWMCRSVNAAGFSTLRLAYYWRGDPDAEDNEAGIVEYRAGGSCDSESGWTAAASHELDDGNSGTSSWSTFQLVSLPASLNGASFFLRYRNSANSGDETFRIDLVRVTGVPN